MKKLLSLLMCGLLLFGCSDDVKFDEPQFEEPEFFVTPTTFHFGEQGGTSLFSCQCTAGKFERCYFVEHLTLTGFRFMPNEWTEQNQNLVINCPALRDVISSSGSCGAIYVDYKLPDGQITTKHVCYLYFYQE